MTAAELGIAVIGLGWMGEVHARAFLRVGHHFPRLKPRPRLVAAADPVPERAEAAGRRYGFERVSATWRDLLDDPRVQAVSITTPNHLHHEIGVAMARAGKHIWIEKPVGRNSAEVRAVAAAMAEGGPCGPTIDDAVRAAEVTDAIAESVRTGAWVGVPNRP